VAPETNTCSVSKFISLLGSEVTTITADSSISGITKSEDGKTVNVYGIKITGEFGEDCQFPTTLVTADLTGLDTSGVTSMSHMFYNCSGLTTLNVSSFDTSNVENIDHMFSGCSNLTTIYASSNFTTTNVTNSSNMFSGCTSLTGGNGTAYDSSYTDKTYARIDASGTPGYFTEKQIELTVNEFITALGTDVTTITANSTQPGITKSEDGATVNVYGVKITGEFKNETGYRFPTTLTEADLSGLDTSMVTSMSHMFYLCSKLENLDLSSFNTSKVTDMSYMFYLDKSLINIDLRSFDTSNVTSMSYMFLGCSKLTSLDVNNFNTSNVTSMNSIFRGCSSLTSLDLSKFDTSNVTSMSYMFYNCSGLTSLDLSTFNTSNVIDMGYMFHGCSALTT